jgi:hypothetical protein
VLLAHDHVFILGLVPWLITSKYPTAIFRIDDSVGECLEDASFRYLFRILPKVGLNHRIKITPLKIGS